jgi:hypothetical protein
MASENSPAKNDEPVIHILKEAKCKTLAGTATLTYQLCIDDAGEVSLKISGNTGGGMYSAEHVPYLAIREALDAWPEDQSINSMTLRPLFRGKSVNTPSFLLAALIAEKLLEPLPKKKRCHRVTDEAPFLASLEKLRGKPGKPTRKKPAAKAGAKRPAAKKKSPATRKKT